MDDKEAPKLAYSTFACKKQNKSVSMSVGNEFDSMLRKAMGLMHSPHSSSATELRFMLDELITRYGGEKTLTSKLSKRHLDEELSFPGRATTPPPPQPKPDADEIINLTHSPAKTISDSPDTIMDSDDAISGVGGIGGGTEDDGNLKDFGDLNCCVCSEMMFTATNRLVECSKCGTLYHQECHKPPITDEEASEDHEHNWQCDNCCNKPATTKSTAGVVVIPDEPVSLISKIKSPVTSSRSSSSSNSSSSFFKLDPASVPSSTVSTKTHHKSSSRSQREERSSSRSKTSVVTPTINVISAADKSSSHSSSSSSRKSSSHSSSSKSSSSKSSRHHESSSRRKGK